MEGMSFSVAFREFNKTRGDKSFLRALFDSRIHDPGGAARGHGRRVRALFASSPWW